MRRDEFTSRRIAALFWTAMALAGLGVEPARGGGPNEAVTAKVGPIAETSDTYESQGKRIAVERFEPTAPGRYPVVVLLHGSSGPILGAPMLRGLARELAGRGYLVLLPHYFDRTGTTLADRAMMERHFPDWLRTIADATTYGTERPNADPERVALAGYSLGGYLAVSLSTFDPRVRAVVDYSGGLPDQLADRESSLVPTLILHGEADPIVPVDEARKLERRLQTHGIDHEIRIFPGVGHGFLGEAAREADRLAVEFLERRLKSTP